MAEIEKGTISAIEAGPVDRNNDSTRARVISATRAGEVSRPITIPWWLRGKMANLKAGDEVVFAIFPDMTGYIIGRADGEWPGIVPGDVELTGRGTMEDMVTGQVASYNSHTHPGVQSGDNSTKKPQ